MAMDMIEADEDERSVRAVERGKREESGAAARMQRASMDPEGRCPCCGAVNGGDGGMQDLEGCMGLDE